MKSLVAAVLTASVLSGFALTSAQAAPRGELTPYERGAIHRSERALDVLKARVRADGHVTAWERAQVRMAEARHNALVYRYRHN
jgi:hypothetical protein